MLLTRFDGGSVDDLALPRGRCRMAHWIRDDNVLIQLRRIDVSCHDERAMNDIAARKIRLE